MSADIKCKTPVVLHGRTALRGLAASAGMAPVRHIKERKEVSKNPRRSTSSHRGLIAMVCVEGLPMIYKQKGVVVLFFYTSSTIHNISYRADIVNTKLYILSLIYTLVKISAHIWQDLLKKIFQDKSGPRVAAFC